MPELPDSAPYYLDCLQNGTEEIEGKLKQLLAEDIESLEDLEAWIINEQILLNKAEEAVKGHALDFYRNTEDEEKRNMYLQDQKTIQPLLKTYQSALNRKFNTCRFTPQLDEERYGLMRKVRRMKEKLYCEANLPLEIRETEIIAGYTKLMGSLTAVWEAEEKPYTFVKAMGDHPDRKIRERSWRSLAAARKRIKPKTDEMMNELLAIRHRIARNAGYRDYRDYMFDVKKREYTIQDCNDLHQSAEKYLVPVWRLFTSLFEKQLGVEIYRPWDMGPCTLKHAPFQSGTELLNGVEEMLGKTDNYFQRIFKMMREEGLLDVEPRFGKSPGAYCEYLSASRNAFILSNFSPSFSAVIALIHEMGHALNEYLQYTNIHGPQEVNRREEAAELFSHSLELLLMDKLNTFYSDPEDFKNAQREELHRAFQMLLNPLAGDLFQHWLYTNPGHSSEERDAKFTEINKRFIYVSVDLSGLEADFGNSWIHSVHYFKYPFYKVEYAISELGALRLLRIYRKDPQKAIALFKNGGRTDLSQTLEQIYHATGIEWDFSGKALKETAGFVEALIEELK